MQKGVLCDENVICRVDFEKRMNELNFSNNDASLIWNFISVNPVKEHEFKNAMQVFNTRK